MNRNLLLLGGIGLGAGLMYIFDPDRGRRRRATARDAAAAKAFLDLYPVKADADVPAARKAAGRDRARVTMDLWAADQVRASGTVYTYTTSGSTDVEVGYTPTAGSAFVPLLILKGTVAIDGKPAVIEVLAQEIQAAAAQQRREIADLAMGLEGFLVEPREEARQRHPL